MPLRTATSVARRSALVRAAGGESEPDPEEAGVLAGASTDGVLPKLFSGGGFSSLDASVIISTTATRIVAPPPPTIIAMRAGERPNPPPSSSANWPAGREGDSGSGCGRAASDSAVS